MKSSIKVCIPLQQISEAAGILVSFSLVNLLIWRLIDDWSASHCPVDFLLLCVGGLAVLLLSSTKRCTWKYITEAGAMSALPQRIC